MLAQAAFCRMMDSVDGAPWGAAAGRHAGVASREFAGTMRHDRHHVLYSPEERRRRDASPWTMVQGLLAPLQFLVFAVSLCLVLRTLVTGEGEAAATVSIITKTMVLYTIMVTGAIWEREVFGRYLFAPAFFWEDTVSMGVIALHTLYLGGLLSGSVDTHHLMIVALAAYTAYLVNAAQFVLKLRTARMEERRADARLARATPHRAPAHIVAGAEPA